MAWADARARLLNKAPVAEAPAIERRPFEPSLPHFTIDGHGGWLLTPYALAHCIVCGAELPEDVSGECPPCRQQIDETVMPWEGSIRD